MSKVKYKLIKEFPGSPVLGTLEEPISDTVHMMSNGKYGYNFDKYPEFWKKVIERDYEILSILIKRSEKHELRKVESYDTQDYIECLSKSDGNSIHSVKRLSDGEIFTVGDYFFNGYCNTKIIKFSIFNNELKVLTNSGTTTINHVQCIKKPLFTTDDGKKVFEGDTVYIVHNSLRFETFKVFKGMKSYHKVFAFRDTAESYIKANTKFFSYSDIITRFNLSIAEQKDLFNSIS